MDNYFLRCGRIDSMTGDTGKRIYEVYGVWEKYDDNSKIVNRNVTKLSQLAGQEYRLLWPLMGTGRQGTTRYMVASASARLYRSLDVEEAALPPGTYYLEYEVTDTFNRPIRLPRITMVWDGSSLTFPDLEWSGSVHLDLFGAQ